jgi:hypothetical protein
MVDNAGKNGFMKKIKILGMITYYKKNVLSLTLAINSAVIINITHFWRLTNYTILSILYE